MATIRSFTAGRGGARERQPISFLDAKSTVPGTSITQVAETVAMEMNLWAGSFLGRAIIADWREQCKRTTRTFRPLGLHLDDRQVRADGEHGLSASMVAATLYVVNNHAQLRSEERSIVLYLPKIQTAREAAFWHRPKDLRTPAARRKEARWPECSRNHTV